MQHRQFVHSGVTIHYENWFFDSPPDNCPLQFRSDVIPAGDARMEGVGHGHERKSVIIGLSHTQELWWPCFVTTRQIYHVFIKVAIGQPWKIQRQWSCSKSWNSKSDHERLLKVFKNEKLESDKNSEAQSRFKQKHQRARECHEKPFHPISLLTS
jgi:hypothetical protein